MAELQPTDEFLVNRGDITYTQEQGTLMANLETTDKLLVNRSDVTYTITGQELIDSVTDLLDLTVTLAPTSGYVGFPVTATAIVSGGKEPDGGYQFDYQWYLADDPSGTNASAIAGATSESYEPVDSDIGEYLGCTVSTTDLFSNTATDTAYIGPIASRNSSPAIDSVVLTETGDGSARFTSQTFAYNTVMAIDGLPAPDYSLKAKLSGSAFNFSAQSDVITKVEPNKLTVASNKDLDIITDDIYMTDGQKNPDGTFIPASYTLQTSEIASVDDSNASVDWVARIETDSSFNPSFPASNAVDGDNDSFADSNGGGSYIRINLKGLFPSGAHTFSVKTGGATDGVDFITDLETKSQPLKTGGGAQIYTETVSGVPEYIVCKSSSAVSIYYFGIDGEVITDGVTASQLILTFATPNPDLKYFQAGDIVQLTTYNTNAFVVRMPAYDNNFYIEAVYFDGKELWDSTQFPDDQPSGEYIEITGADSDANFNKAEPCQGFWANGITGRQPFDGESDSSWRPVDGESVKFNWNESIDFKLLSILVATGSVDGLAGTVELLDGTEVANINLPTQLNEFTLVEGIPSSAFKVVSTDTTANTMTVDGGEWEGSDGSGDAAGDTEATVGPFTAEGTLITAVGTEAFLSASSGRWIADNKAGIPFFFVPTVPSISIKIEAYGTLQIVNDKAQLTAIQANDPGFLNVTSQDYTVQFPSVFATGNAPDTDLPEGTSLSVIVKAENIVGESIVESNTVLPSLPNPEGAAGPITNATAIELTVGKSGNLDTFVANDALVMVDDAGAVASYTPITSTIASVSADVNPVLTFEDPNPDLKYFQPGDLVQSNTVARSEINVYDSAGTLLPDTDYLYLGKAVDIAADDSEGAIIDLLLFDGPYGEGAFNAYRPSAYGGDQYNQAATTKDLRTIEFVFQLPVDIIKDRPGEPVYVVVAGGFQVYVDDVFAGETTLAATGTVDIKDYLPFKKLKLVPQDDHLQEISKTGFYGLRDEPGIYYNLSLSGAVVVSTDTTANTMTVDSGVWLGADGSGNATGDTEVTGPAKSGTGNFVSTNGTDTVTIQNSNNEWIDNTNRLGFEFFIKKFFTALNANDPAHVAMSQAISAAFTAFPQNAAARRTSIASSLYRLMAGETLTAEETAVLTSTVVTAVNAAEPFALDGYYPLYYTAAAANAASSVGDHHTHDMDGETFYMPDGGTIYHGSYVLPEEEESSGY